MNAPKHVFACRITDRDYLAAFALDQPEALAVGQNWMRASDGAELSIKALYPDAPLGTLIDLGSDSYTVRVGEKTLREEWVCTDLPELTPVSCLGTKPISSPKGVQ